MEYVRVIIHIRRVWLAVRFNCKLSFIVRNELSQKICEIDNTYSLFKGECLVNQTMYFELPLQILTNKCKKLKLIVMMISANGMVPAGFINFNPRPKSLYEHFEAIMPIQRCEDARAQIKFMHMYENCTKTPIQNSYVNRLMSKQDQNLYENGGGSYKSIQKNSHSANRQNVSARKYRQKDSFIQSKIQKVGFSKPLVSPRTLIKQIQGVQTQKSIKLSQFQNKIAEEQPNQSSINPLTMEQLMKQHQQYWLQIIRLQQEVQSLKQQNNNANQLNNNLKKEAQQLKEYYQGHQEKIHAFISEIQENADTIKRLEQEIEQQRNIISQKQQFQKESQNLRETQSNQLRDSLHKYADLNEALLSLQQQNKGLKLMRQMDSEKILFLQNQSKKHAHENLQLKQIISQYEAKQKLLGQTNAKYEKTIDILNNTIEQLKKENVCLVIQLGQINNLKSQIQSMRFQQTKYQQKISNLQADLMLNFTQKQQLAQQYSEKDQEVLISSSKNLDLLKQLEELKEIHLHQKQTSSIQQSKLKIYQQQLELTSKQKQQFQYQLKRKQQSINLLKSQIQNLSQQNKIVQIKLIEYQASLSGKISIIEKLKAQLQKERKQKNQSLEKIQSLQQEFEEIYVLLSKQTDQKNKVMILLTTIEENTKILELENKSLKEKCEEISKKNGQVEDQCERYKRELSQQLQKYRQQKDRLKSQQIQLTLKVHDLQIQLESNLIKLQQLNNSPPTNLYQQSYNQSMTSLMLKYGKLQQQTVEKNKQISRLRQQMQQINEKYIQKDNQIVELKKFTHNKLLENLKLMKENEETKLRGQKHQQEIQAKDEIIKQLKFFHQQDLIKIDQLTNELQFVTEVLKRERQQKSDIQKDFDHQDNELPQITEAANLKQESFDEIKQGEVNLEIQSKVISQQYEKDDAGDQLHK